MSENFEVTKIDATKQTTQDHNMGHQDGLRECYMPNFQASRLGLTVDNIYDVGVGTSHLLAEREKVPGKEPLYMVHDQDKVYLEFGRVGSGNQMEVAQDLPPGQFGGLPSIESGTDIYRRIEAVRTQINDKFGQMPECDKPDNWGERSSS